MSAVKEQAPIIGHLLAGKYAIVKQIGHGGMGDVYQGVHVLIDRQVAIKVMHPRWVQSDPKCLSRFQMEARALSYLNHPNIITVFDFGIMKEGTAYFVMDYIDGEGLDQIFKRDKQISIERMFDIFSQACDALAYAHEKGIVHRDLKPSNIMVAPDHSGKDQVKIVDFGIAKFLPGHSHSLQYSQSDSQVVGSPLYMSPEQCMGKGTLDGRSDIYSLGCLLYQALTGRPPVTEDTVLSIIYAHINNMPTPFGIVAPALKLPAQLEAVVFKALSKDPANRQQSMRQLKSELVAAFDEYKCRGNDQDEASVLPRVGEELGQLEIASPELVPHLHNLSEFYLANKQPERAEQHLNTAVRCVVKAYGVWDVRVAEAVKKLADYYRESAKFSDAEALYFDLLSIKRKALGDTHPDIPCLLLRIADMNFHLEDYLRAKRYYLRCLRLSERLFGADDPALTPVLSGLAATLRKLGNYEASAAVCTRALSLKEVQLGEDHFELASTLVGLGAAYRFQENFQAAEKVFQRALSIYEQTLGSTHENVASVLLLIAELYSAQGRNGDADDCYAHVVEMRQAPNRDNINVAAAHDIWAAYYISRQELPSAASAYCDTLPPAETAPDAGHRQVASTLNTLGWLYTAKSDYPTAKKYYQRAAALSGSSTKATTSNIIRLSAL